MQAISNEAEVRAAVEAEFGADAEPLLALLRPSLRVGGLHEDPDDAPLRLAGPGLLGPGEEWPTWEGEPLTFLAAIDCGAVDGLLDDNPLPASGTVTAWVHRDAEYGSPEHLLGGATSDATGASRLMHYPVGAELRETAVPEGVVEPVQTTPRALSLLRDVMWPIDLYSLRRESDLGLTDAHVDFAEGLLEEAASNDLDTWIQTRIGGWPTLHGSEKAAALVDAGIVTDRGRPDYRADEATPVMARAWETWRPLIQLGADLDLGWNWFLDGVLIFLGREGDRVPDAVAYCSRQ